jgi:SAM-dependent methyltransferase
MKVFNDYARYYDLLYRDKDYQAETAFIVSLLNNHSPQARFVLEMGCGTGIHAKLMAEAGYDVMGIDLSETMLISANERKLGLAQKLRARLNFALGDVRTYRASKKFDVVLSLFHVFSYQTSNKDLSAAFQTANEHLDPGGILIFDYWYGPAVLSQRPETRVKRISDDDLSIVRIAESHMDDIRSTVQVNFETTIRTSKLTDVINETHIMRYLFVPEIELLAAAHGLEAIAHQEWLGSGTLSVGSWSGCSVLRKR